MLQFYFRNGGSQISSKVFNYDAGNSKAFTLGNFPAMGGTEFCFHLKGITNTGLVSYRVIGGTSSLDGWEQKEKGDISGILSQSGSDRLCIYL